MLSIAIHGGAGAVHPDNFSAEEVLAYEASLSESLKRGYTLLEKGGSALDAVAAAIVVMEDSALFNAGCGSVLTEDDKIQMDASVMSGLDQSCGGVTLIETVKNPIKAALMVREHTPHRILGGRDAELLAKKHGLEFREKGYFITARRLEQLKLAQEKKKIQLDHSMRKKIQLDHSMRKKIQLDHSMGTVGAVALDAAGNLAAATSTGGLTNRFSGRISDSSIIGAGTYANNQTLAISGTGTGDLFIQNVLAYDAHALMLYRGFTLEQACQEVLRKLAEAGGDGGIIALDTKGKVCLEFISTGMFRGFQNSKGELRVECFR